MIDYIAHPARPTTYRGTRFRSRLEARWAAFFDAIDVAWVYEPMDLGPWSPDFLVEGNVSWLLEVKPTRVPVPEVLEKIRGEPHPRALIGLGPLNVRSRVGFSALGWTPDGSLLWEDALWGAAEPPRAAVAWATATNAVQWRPR